MLELPDDADEGDKKTYRTWQGLILDRIGIDPKTDEIKFNNSYFSGGQLVRGGFDLRFAWGADGGCIFASRIGSGKEIKGSMRCTYKSNREIKKYGKNQSILPYTIELP